MSRRQSNPNARRFTDSGTVPLTNAFRQKSRAVSFSLPILTVSQLGQTAFQAAETTKWTNKEALVRVDGQHSCTLEVFRALPHLSKAYGDSMQKILHVGSDTCAVVSKLLKEDDTEAWGIEPYDLEDAGSNCKALVHKGIVRVADVKFPLPYKEKSFSLVIVSDALDYLSPKYLNKTVPELARVSKDGLVLLVGYPGHHRAKVPDMSKFGRPSKLRSQSWWIRYFMQMDLQENEAVSKKFEQAATMGSYVPGCQIFHLKS